MPDVFISYSRKDKPFVADLQAPLRTRGRDAWVDWEDIPLTADWEAEIHAGIEAAHGFVFVISPDSVASEQSVLVAAESLRRQPSPEAQQALFRALSLLPAKRGTMRLDPGEVPSLVGHDVAVGAYSGDVEVWDVTTGRLAATLSHDLGVNDVAFSPDGRLLATVSNDRTVRLWDWRLCATREMSRPSHDGYHCSQGHGQ